MFSFVVVLTLLCAFLTHAYGLPSVKPIDDVQPEKTVQAHNEIRAAVKVAPLVWNETLAVYAQNYANKLSKTGKCAHTDMKHSDGPYGENIAIGWVQPKDQMSGPIAAMFWLTEKPNYDYATNKCKGICGHYTQVVANQSTSVGCGSYRCHNNELIWIICNYFSKPMGDANTRPY
ncbi:hypothetical protein HID58_085353 [Brassica napus]|uniref:SCP domain-containing protein n=2 Tax=Brassica TaxID=3705 RepID=A0ABQ7XMC7_BRANA|nr:pathogenesis-related protein 1-like [Brassica napus]KAG2277719.1 hypothetical protein Bca52824_060274 [Brassica carinata]KAH0857092.1 hypothetical protein HID58_085353 [Brassica napus]